jgi:toxin ParE1/3/4
MKVRYRSRARLDIETIHEYIAKRSPRAAAEVIARIRHAADRLGVLPYMGHAGRDAGTYEWVVTRSPYIIVYEVDEEADEIVILAVFHGARRR